MLTLYLESHVELLIKPGLNGVRRRPHWEHRAGLIDPEVGDGLP